MSFTPCCERVVAEDDFNGFALVCVLHGGKLGLRF